MANKYKDDAEEYLNKKYGSKSDTSNDKDDAEEYLNKKYGTGNPSATEKTNPTVPKPSQQGTVYRYTDTATGTPVYSPEQEFDNAVKPYEAASDNAYKAYTAAVDAVNAAADQTAYDTAYQSAEAAWNDYQAAYSKYRTQYYTAAKYYDSAYREAMARFEDATRPEEVKYRFDEKAAENNGQTAPTKPSQQREDEYTDTATKNNDTVSYYTSHIDEAISKGDYDAAIWWMNKLTGAELTQDQRQAANYYINELYKDIGSNGKDNLGWLPNNGSYKLPSAQEINDMTETERGLFEQELLETGDEDAYRAYQIWKETGNSEAYRYYRVNGTLPTEEDLAKDQKWLDYNAFTNAQQYWLTQNANTAFVQKAKQTLADAKADPNSSQHMDNYTTLQQAVYALDNLIDQMDVEGNQGTYVFDNDGNLADYTAKYLIDELKQYGIDLSGITEENFREKIEAAQALVGHRVDTLREVLSDHGYDVDTVAQFLKYQRDLQIEKDRAESASAWVQAQRENNNVLPVADAILQWGTYGLAGALGWHLTEGQANQAIASLGTVAENSALSGLVNIPTWANLLSGGGNVNRPNEYRPIAPHTKQSDLVRGAISGEMSDVGKFFYNAAMSWADSTANAAMFGGVGGLAEGVLGEAAKTFVQAGTLLTMGANAATSQANEIIKRGGNRQQAIVGGLAAGIVEAATEIWSVENLIRLSDGVGFKQLAKELAKSFFSEASEEVAGSILDKAIDNMNMGNLSEDSQAVRYYVEEKGMSVEEAQKQVLIDNLRETLEAGLSGGLSGGFSVAAVGVPSSIRQQNQLNRTYQQYESLTKDEQSAKALQAYAEKNGIKWNAKKAGKAAYEVVQSLEQKMEGKSLSAAQAVYDEAVQEYGEGIREAAKTALQEAASVRFSESGSIAGLEHNYKGELQSLTSEGAREAVQEAYNNTVLQLGMREYEKSGMGGGRKVDSSTSLRSAQNDMSVSYAADGKTVQTEIRKINDDGTVTLADGHVSTVDALQMDADTKSTLQELTKVVQGESANAMLSLYQTGGTGSLVDALTVYDLAKRGVAQQTAVQQVKGLDAEAAAQVWKLGNQAFQQWSEVKRQFKTKGSGKVNLSGIKWERLTSQQKTQVWIASRIARALGVDVTFFESGTKTGKDGKTRYTGAQGSYADGQIMLDVNAGANYTTDLKDGILKTMSHELTHFIEQYSRAEYAKLKAFVFEVLTEQKGADGVERLIQEKIDRSQEESGIDPSTPQSEAQVDRDGGNSLRPSATSLEEGGISRAEAESEVVADACEMLLKDSKTVQELVVQNRTLGEKIKAWIDKFVQKLRSVFGDTKREEAKAVMEQAEQIQKIWDAALKAAAEANSQAEKNTATEGGAQFSVREIVDKNGKNYGMGVYMDSTLLSGLTENERVEMFRMYLDEVSGQSFDATGKNNTLTQVKIAEKGRRFTNDRGRSVTVNDDLRRKFKKNHTKQEAIALIDEVIQTARYRDEAAARHTHGWLDDNGNNPWQAWRTYMQDPDGTVYEAILHITTADDGGLYLYDITPVKIEETEQSGNSDTGLSLSGEQSGNSDTGLSDNSVAQPAQEVKQQFSERDYAEPSDVELLMGLSEEDAAKGEQRQMLKEFQAKQRKIEALQKRLAAQEDQIADLKDQMKTTDRALNTKGISGIVRSIMTEYGMGDANDRGVAKTAAQMLTDVYTETLEKIDRGDADGAWQTLSDGEQRVAEYLIDNGTYTEKFGYRWVKTSWARRYANTTEARDQAVRDIMTDLTSDFSRNRYRDAIRQTAADRLVEKTAKGYQAKLDTANEKLAEQTKQTAALQEENKNLRRRLDSDNDYEHALREQIKTKERQLEQAKQEARTGTKAQERVAALEEKVKALKAEREAWKNKAKHNATLARQFAESKNQDLRQQQRQSQKALEGAIKEKEAMARDLERQIARERSILEGKLKPLEMQRLLKAEREKAEARIAEQKEQKFSNYKERQNESRLRKRIQNLADDIKHTMLHPTEHSYVPAALYESMGKLTDVLAVEPRPGTKAAEQYRQMQDAIHKMANEYQALKDVDDFAFASEFDQDIRDKISEIERIFDRYSTGDWTESLSDNRATVRDLTASELQQIYELVKSINTSMKNATRLMGNAKYQSVFEAAQSMAEQQQAMESFNEVSKHEQNKRTRLLGNLSVMRAVEMMSNWDRSAALYQLMQSVEQGTVEADRWVMQYNKSLLELKTGKNETAYRDALTKQLDYGVKDNKGLTVKMTKLQALQILMTAEREAHNDKLVHLQKGGAVIRDALAMQDGKKTVKSQTVKVTPELLQKIQESLTGWDKAYMEAIRSYFAKESAEVKRLTYQLKHRAMETEQYYVPYTVDQNYLDTKLDEQGALTSLWVRTPGSTQQLVKNAGQPVIIDGMDTVMQHHVKEIANYLGLALPVRDFAKVYNARLSQGDGELALPVKQTIFDNYGSKGQHLLTQAIMDVQGATGKGNSWSSAISEHLNWLYSAFVKSALLINPSVTIKQAASYIAAESVLSHRALIAGNRPLFTSTDSGNYPSLIAFLFANPEGKTAQRLYDEIDRHTSMHYQRRLGMSYEELASEANRSSALRRAMNNIGASMEQNKFGHFVRKAGQNFNPTTWIQRMDVATTAALWVAAKEQARMDLGLDSSTALRSAQNDMNGEYWQHVTELYEQTLRETQPMYDGLHRTANQKQQGGLMQYLFPFRTVPIQNHGQVASAYEAMKAAKNKSKAEQETAIKHFYKTVWANTESAVVFSLMTFLAAALKRKTKKYRDEDDEFTLASIGKGIGLDVLNVWASNLFPLYGSELYDLIDKSVDALMGKSSFGFDTFSVGVVDLVNDLAETAESLLGETGKIARGEAKDGTALGKAALNMMLKAGKLCGIPADTIKTYFEGTKDNIADILEGRIPAINNESVERSATVNANRYLKAWQAGDTEKMDAVYQEMVGNYVEGGKSQEEAEKAARSALGKEAKAQRESGAWDIAQELQFLRETGLYTEDALQERAADYIKEAFGNGNLTEEAAAEALVQLSGYDEDKAYWAVQRWEATAEHEEDEDYSYSQYENLRDAIDGNKDPKAAMKELTEHGVKEENAKAFAKKYILGKFEDGEYNDEKLRNYLSRYCGITEKDAVDKIVNNAKCYKETGVHFDDLKDAYQSGELTEQKAVSALKKYGGKTEFEAQNRVRYWQFQKDYPDANLSEETVTAYYVTKPDNYGKTMKDAGISMKDYITYCERAAACKGEDKNGDGKTDSGSKKKQVMAEIDKLPLTREQKDALYYLNGWAKSKIYEAPWH